MANQHAYTGPPIPQLPEPTHAERVRTLFSRSSTGTLSTQSRKHPGFPFGSLMPFALDATGCPLFLISTMAMHTQNLAADGRASLFVAQSAADGDPLGAARATLVGNAARVPPEDVPAVREAYLTAHENSRYWVDFTDFHFYRLAPVELYYVGGFGVMGWVGAQDYTAAQPDPLADAAPGVLAHMNADHVDSLLTLARTHAQLEGTTAAMTSVDRLGFTVRVITADGPKGARINFPREVKTAAATREMLIEMLRPA